MLAVFLSFGTILKDGKPMNGPMEFRASGPNTAVVLSHFRASNFTDFMRPPATHAELLEMYAMRPLERIEAVVVHITKENIRLVPEFRPHDGKRFHWLLDESLASDFAFHPEASVYSVSKVAAPRVLDRMANRFYQTAKIVVPEGVGHVIPTALVDHYSASRSTSRR